MLIKFVKGNSAGIVTTNYLSSTGTAHDEVDFEFLGNVTGQPHVIHTNIFCKGVGNREMQFYPWFDPTADFHNYTIHWNPTAVVWYVDSKPIRVFRNYESKGICFPNKQGMRSIVSLWDADDWATRGGLDKTNWTGAPFFANFRNYRARACPWVGNASIPQCAAVTPANWWTAPAYKQLTSTQRADMYTIQSKYRIYNYCTDTKRFNGVMAPECSLPQY